MNRFVKNKFGDRKVQLNNAGNEILRFILEINVWYKIVKVLNWSVLYLYLAAFLKYSRASSHLSSFSRACPTLFHNLAFLWLTLRADRNNVYSEFQSMLRTYVLTEWDTIKLPINNHNKGFKWLQQKRNKL